MIGVGAVGAVLASNLTKFLGKENVECLCDGERKSRYERDGIFLNGEKQNFNFVESKNAHESDLVIIATKNLQLNDAISMMENAYTSHTLILSVLNGIQSEREIAKAYGEANLLYGFVISLNSIHEKNRVECSDFGMVVFGEKSNEKTERVAALSRLFEKSKIRYKNPDDIQLEMWKKFLINSVFNSLSSITRSPYGGFKYEVMQNLARKIGKEVVSVANAEGIALTEEMIENAIKMMCGHDPRGKTSMLQDMEANRKTENEFFLGTVSNIAKKHKIAVPYSEFLHDIIEGSECVREI